MALSAFDDKAQEPQKPELNSVLGEASELWDQLVSSIESGFDPLAEEWVFSGKKWGWALRLKHKKRAVLYMTPSEGFFYVGFALGKKAVNAAHTSDLPKNVLRIIDCAQDYVEGKAVRLEVRSVHDVSNVVEIANIKMAN